MPLSGEISGTADGNGPWLPPSAQIQKLAKNCPQRGNFRDRGRKWALATTFSSATDTIS
jgi:hypothetical protein